MIDKDAEKIFKDVFGDFLKEEKNKEKIKEDKDFSLLKEFFIMLEDYEQKYKSIDRNEAIDYFLSSMGYKLVNENINCFCGSNIKLKFVCKNEPYYMSFTGISDDTSMYNYLNNYSIICPFCNKRSIVNTFSEIIDIIEINFKKELKIKIT